MYVVYSILHCVCTRFILYYLLYTVLYTKVHPILYYTILYYTIHHICYIGYQYISAVLSAYTRPDGRLGHIGHRLLQQLY